MPSSPMSPSSSTFERLSIDMYVTLRNLELQWQSIAAACDDAVALLDAKERCVTAWREPLRARLDALFDEMGVELEGLLPEARRAAVAFHSRLVRPYFQRNALGRAAGERPLGYVGADGRLEVVYAGVEQATTPLGSLLGVYGLGLAHGEPWIEEEDAEGHPQAGRGRRTG